MVPINSMEPLSHPASLLILTSRENESEDIVQTLRNAGLAVQGSHTADPDEIDDAIGSRSIELILCCEYDPDIDLDTCMARYRQLELDVPLIIIADPDTDSASLIAAMRNGARDLTERGDRDHLQLVVTRELSDLTNRREASQLREQLRECEQRASEAMKSSDEAVALVQEGVHIQVNPAYCELLLFDDEDDLYGYPLLDLVATAKQSDMRQTLRMLTSLNEGESRTVDVPCLRSDETLFNARLIFTQTNLEGDPCLRVVMQQAPQPAGEGMTGLIDPDTGLADRTALMAELAYRLEGTGKKPEIIAVVYLGIDVYPKLIQNYSLTTGLEAVSAFGTSLRSLIPAEAYVARVGDDGFVLLIDNISEMEALELASKIIDKAHLPQTPGGGAKNERACTTGVVLAKPGKDSATDILNKAYRDYLLGAIEPDSGMISGSTHMRRLPDSGFHSDISDEDRKFAARIRHALEGDGFQLVYQPIVSLKGDSQESYNVFLRLRGDEKQLHEAKVFLAAAIQSGRMVAVDRWVIKRAIEELANERSKDRKLNFFVNIAEETLQEDNLLIWICDYLREHQARGNWLTIQVLEDHARRHPSEFVKLSDGLKKVKCRIALNRFGLGPKPEALLEDAHADFIKFAPEFGAGLADDSSKQKRLTVLANNAREAGMRCVVTGVEDARSLAVLWTAGIDYVQGNFLQKPLPSIEPK